MPWPRACGASRGAASGCCWLTISSWSLPAGTLTMGLSSRSCASAASRRTWRLLGRRYGVTGERPYRICMRTPALFWACHGVTWYCQGYRLTLITESRWLQLLVMLSLLLTLAGDISAAGCWLSDGPLCSCCQYFSCTIAGIHLHGGWQWVSFQRHLWGKGCVLCSLRHSTFCLLRCSPSFYTVSPYC